MSTKPLRREELRPQINMDYLSPLDVPEGVKKEGFSYAWVRKSIRGEDDYRVEQMAARGWTPVPADRCPGMSLDPLNRNVLSKEFVCYKDVLLMERPSVYSEREEEYLNQLNRNKLKSLRGVSDDLKGFHQSLPVVESF